MSGEVVAVSISTVHGPPKHTHDSVRLLEGRGVEGDVHLGAEVKHRSRARRNAEQPNLRQVHLIHEELHEDLRARGYDAVAPGVMGENVTTRGLDLLSLPRGARLRLGDEAIVEVTGLRNPCSQLDGIQQGLMKATLARDDDGNLLRLAGVMSVVIAGGEVRPGDAIEVDLPEEPHSALAPV